MKTHTPILIQRGFTLMETVIAIAVIAVLITGFIAVFAPAIEGIRRSISGEEANRLTSTLEHEIATLRQGQQPATASTGFDKAFNWIRESNETANALLIYQYRGDIQDKRDDDTPVPYTGDGVIAGRDYIMVPMLRRKSETVKIAEDFAALEGRVFVVRCTHLVYSNNGSLERFDLTNPDHAGKELPENPEDYLEAVLPFAADFYSLPNRSPQYLQGDAFADYFEERMNRPIFTRNIAVRR